MANGGYLGYVGAQEPLDAIAIKGKPPIEMIIPGGVHGDQATIARVVSTLFVVLRSPPGLVTVADLPAVSAKKG